MREGVMMSLSVRDGHGTANSISIALRHIIQSTTRTRTVEGGIFTGNNGVATASRQTNVSMPLAKWPPSRHCPHHPFRRPAQTKSRAVISAYWSLHTFTILPEICNRYYWVFGLKWPRVPYWV